MNRIILAGIGLFVLAACVRLNTSGGGLSAVSGDELVMIYGRGSSALHEDATKVAEYVMTVYATVSDSAYVFGHLVHGDFEEDTTTFEGPFRVHGGELRHFAVRDSLGSVYGMRKGDYTFSGPAMSPSRAVYPVMEKEYYSIATLTFEIARDSTVTAELVASSPNGFAPAR